MAINQASSGGGTSANLAYGHNATIDGLPALSVFSWAKVGNLTVVDSNAIVFKRTADAANAGLFKLAYDNDSAGTGNNIAFCAYNWTTAFGQWDFDGPQDLGWHAHLVTYSYGSTANAPIYFLDGVAKPVVNTAQSPAGTLGADSAPVSVGGSAQAATKSFGGSLAHAAVWNAILTPLEAQLLAGGTPPSLIRPDALVFYCPCAQDPTQALDLGLAQLGTAAVTGTWLPADDPYGLLLPARGEAPVAFSPVFQSLPYRRPNMPLYRR